MLLARGKVTMIIIIIVTHTNTKSCRFEGVFFFCLYAIAIGNANRIEINLHFYQSLIKLNYSLWVDIYCAHVCVMRYGGSFVYMFVCYIPLLLLISADFYYYLGIFVFFMNI